MGPHGSSINGILIYIYICVYTYIIAWTSINPSYFGQVPGYPDRHFLVPFFIPWQRAPFARRGSKCDPWGKSLTEVGDPDPHWLWTWKKIPSAGWWFQPLCKNMKVSWDDEILNIWKKKFQTTNQIWSWKIPYTWRFIAGNIICKGAIFHSYVKEPEGKFKASWRDINKNINPQLRCSRTRAGFG